MEEQRVSGESTTVLITGGTSGIGRATAHLFSQRGATVIVTGGDEAPGQGGRRRDRRALHPRRSRRARGCASPGRRDHRRGLRLDERGKRPGPVLPHRCPGPPMATYLAGEDARPITRAVLAVDAGRVATL
jgi:hypothetical protein